MPEWRRQVNERPVELLEFIQDVSRQETGQGKTVVIAIPLRQITLRDKFLYRLLCARSCHTSPRRDMAGSCYMPSLTEVSSYTLIVSLSVAHEEVL